MLMEGWVKFVGPQNTAGACQEKGIAVISKIGVNGDQFSNIKKYVIEPKAPPPLLV